MSELNTNVEKLHGYLDRFKEQGILSLIDGGSQPALSGVTFNATSPVELGKEF